MFFPSLHFAVEMLNIVLNGYDLYYKFESDFKKLDLNLLKNILLKKFDLRAIKIIVRCIIEFIHTYNGNENDNPHKFNNIEVIKVRHDLYVKLDVYYLYYY